MNEIILYAVSCIGLCFILKYGSILEFIRKPLLRFRYFRDLFSCALCLGFWSGVITYLNYMYTPDPYKHLFVYATAGAAICWTADYILDVIIKNGKGF